jgi:hypothetical protein
VIIPQDTISRAEVILAKHLSTYGPNGSTGGGLELVGGSKWWRYRGKPLEGEWIEVRPFTRHGICADLGQMQKDYLRRKATMPATVSTEPSSPASSHGGSAARHSFLPRRAATLGSIKDNAGHEVIGDRVILYIHGMSTYSPTKIAKSQIRRSVLLLIPRYTPISDPTSCQKSWCKSFRPCIPRS